MSPTNISSSKETFWVPILRFYFLTVPRSAISQSHFGLPFVISQTFSRERERGERGRQRRTNFDAATSQNGNFRFQTSSPAKKKRMSERTHLRRGRERERGRPASSKYIFSERLRSSSTGLPSSTSQSNERSQEREREHGRRRRIVFKVHLQRAAPIFKTKQASPSDHFCDREVQNKNKNKNNFTVYSNIPS